ncbi:hypothetical protein [Arcanobacterium hippocoleae]|uniref:hypothetical protein n=1 Tax=Arcanobacterium hippocoleae TaxID=149017 RepID=UPI0033421E6F
MSIALYRRYRPEIFEEVIGQDHVIEPIMAALEAGRTTHAYLFLVRVVAGKLLLLGSLRVV